MDTGKGLVDIYLTHFVGAYNVTPLCTDEYLCHRAIQAFETSEYINNCTTLTHTHHHTDTHTHTNSNTASLALLLGDLNSTPSSLPVTTLRTMTGMQDVYTHARTHDTHTHASTELVDDENGWTCNVNAYADGTPRRVDYILYKTHNDTHTHKHGGWALVDAYTCLKDPVRDMCVSDHCGVVAEFRYIEPHIHTDTHTDDGCAQLGDSTQRVEDISPQCMVLNAEVRQVLCGVMSLIPASVAYSTQHKHSHVTRLYIYPFVFVALFILALVTVLSPWWLVAAFPVLTLMFVVDFFLGLMHHSEEVASLSAVWHRLYIKLRRGQLKNNIDVKNAHVLNSLTNQVTQGIRTDTVSEAETAWADEDLSKYSRNFNAWGSFVSMSTFLVTMPIHYVRKILHLAHNNKTD